MKRICADSKMSKKKDSEGGGSVPVSFERGAFMRRRMIMSIKGC
jgi:hypothetical protein